MRRLRRAITIIKALRANNDLLSPVFRVMYRLPKHREFFSLIRDGEQLLQGNVDALRGMELLLQQQRDLLATGYQVSEMYFLPGMLILKLEDGEVRWMVFNREFKMEIRKG